MLLQEMTYPVGTRVVVWRLEEETAQLLALCREAGIPVEDLLSVPVKRQREKAAERLLLCHALERPVSMGHTEQGAPFVEGSEVNISITHTPRLVALACCDEHAIGIDAEQMDRQQVLRVRDKFLNAVEQQFIPPDDLAAHVIAWTAKEAIIKGTRNSAINWTEGITLSPFNKDVSSIDFHADCGGVRYRLCTCAVDGHYLTVAAPM